MMINVGNGIIEKLPRNSELHIKADGFILLAVEKEIDGKTELKHIAFSREGSGNYIMFRTAKALKNIHVLTQPDSKGQAQTTWFHTITKRRIREIFSSKKIEIDPQLLEEDHLQARIDRAAAAALANTYGMNSPEYESYEEWSQEIDLEDDEDTPLSPHEVRSQSVFDQLDTKPPQPDVAPEPTEKPPTEDKKPEPAPEPDSK